MEHKQPLRFVHFSGSGRPWFSLEYPLARGLRPHDSHASPGHQLQHEPVPSVCSPEDDLIDRLFIDNIPLNSLWAFEDLSDDGTVLHDFSLETIEEATDERSQRDGRRLQRVLEKVRERRDPQRRVGDPTTGRITPVQTAEDSARAAQSLSGIFGKRVVFIRNDCDLEDRNPVCSP